MTTVKLSSALPDDHGLEAIAEQLIAEPSAKRLIVALCHTRKITTDIDTGEEAPSVQLDRVEVVDDPQEIDRLVAILRRRHEARTGKTVLPLDVEDDLRSIFPDDAA